MDLLQHSYKEYNSVSDDRDKYIGGSDIAQIKNITSAMRVVREKLKPQREFVSIYTEFGNIAEGLILDYYSNMTSGGDRGFDKLDNVIVKREEGLDFRGNLDGYDPSTGSVVEIKTLGEKYFNSEVEFKKKLEAYSIQNAFYQTLVEGSKSGWIVVMPRPDYLIDKPFEDWTYQELVDRKIEVEEVIVADLLSQVKAEPVYLDDHKVELERRIALFDKAYAQITNATADSDSGVQALLEEYAELNADKAVIDNRLDEIKDLIAEKFNDTQVWEVGESQITFTPDKVVVRKSFDSKLFAKDNPSLYQKYVVEKSANYKPTLKIK